MTVEDLPQWQAAQAELLKPDGDGETIYERVVRRLQAGVRMDEIREAFESGVCPTCAGTIQKRQVRGGNGDG